MIATSMMSWIVVSWSESRTTDVSSSEQPGCVSGETDPRSGFDSNKRSCLECGTGDARDDKYKESGGGPVAGAETQVPQDV